MKRLSKYLPLHFLVFLILGIGIQFYTQIWTFGFLKLFFVLLLLAISLCAFRNKKGSTIIAVILFFSIGISSVYIQDARNFKNHYTHFNKEKTRVVLSLSCACLGFRFVGAQVVRLNGCAWVLCYASNAATISWNLSKRT